MDTQVPSEENFFPPQKRSGKLKVKLIYKGKSKPLPEESPWAEEDTGSG